MKPSDYHRLTFAAKRARAVVARPTVPCPACKAATGHATQVEPGDLLRHLEGSCTGRRVG